jgi:L-fuconolactonase
MRIDSHQHFWKYDPAEYAWIDDSMPSLRRDFLPVDLKREMDATGFDGCIAVQARQTVDETRWLLGLADAHPFILGVVGWVDLQSPAVEQQLRQLAHSKLVGVRHIVQSEPDDFLSRPAFRHGLGKLEQFGLAYDILVYPRQLPEAVRLVADFPAQRFVLDHLAKPAIGKGAIDQWALDLKNLATYSNVCCKLSGLVTEADWQSWTADDLRPCLEIAFECFGADRLMIGSDWPVCTLAADYQRTMSVVLDFVARRSTADRDGVLGGTAMKLWNLSARGQRETAKVDVQ